MTLFLAIILFGLILENNDLFALAVFENLCLYQSRPSGECLRITLNRFGAAQ